MSQTAATATLLLFLPAAAYAHGLPGEPGFLAGLSHPVGGADHVLAMLAVGLWAALVGGSARIAFPAAFLAGMVAGGAAGLAGAGLAAAEPAILVSVVALGLAVAAAFRAPLAFAAVPLAAFGAAHGLAHGAEAEAGGAGFVAGFLVSTAALHATGLGLGLWFQELQGRGATRALGALAAIAGIALVWG